MTDITVVSQPVIVEVNPQVYEITVSSVGAQGSSGVVQATAPITYNSTTKTVGLDETNLVKNNQANTITTGNQTILTGSDTNKGLVVRRNSASQSANLIEVTNSTGSSVIASVNGYGGLTATGVQNLQFTTDGVVTNNQYGFLTTTNNLSQSLIDHTGIQVNTLATWAANTPYIKGNLVQYQGIAYRRLSDGTSGATFNNAMWQQVTPTPTTSGANTLVLRDGSGAINATTLSANTVSAIQTSGTALTIGSTGSGSGNIAFGTTGGTLQVAAQSGGTGTLTLPTGGGTLATTASNITGTASGISGTQTKNLVYAAPDGSNGTASFRALTLNDLPVFYYTNYNAINQGSFNANVAIPMFGKSVQLQANTIYEVDYFWLQSFTTAQVFTGRINFAYTGTADSNNPITFVCRANQANSGAANQNLEAHGTAFGGSTTLGAGYATATPYVNKIHGKALIRTGAGTGNLSTNYICGTGTGAAVTNFTTMQGSWMRVSAIGANTGADYVDGVWV